GCVDYWTAGLNVLLPQFLYYLGSRSRLVSQDLSAYSLLELLDHVRGEPVRVGRKGLLDYQAAHFPVTRGRVFPVRSGGGLAKGSGGLIDRRNWQRPDITEPNFS